MKRYFLFILVTVVGFCRCNNHADNVDDTSQNQNLTTNPIIDQDSVELAIFEASFDTIEKGLPIFYNMYLTVEMATLFQSINANFNETIVNSLERQNKYLTTSKMAMNLGVYAVDLTYNQVFDKTEMAQQYLDAMENLATELGIPEKFFLSSAERYGRNVMNKDSLYKIANEIYYTSDQYLKENSRENASVLIVMGGWIEAMHIGTRVIEDSDSDVELLDRLVEQKYSLEILIDLLEEHEQDLVVSKYLPKLKRLAETYRAYEINYDEIDLSFKDFEKISLIISDIRTEIVG